MNGAASLVVLVLVSCLAECRPVGQEVLAGEDFLAFLMRGHPRHRRPPPGASQQPQTTASLVTMPPLTTLDLVTTVTTDAGTASFTTTTSLPTTLVETEPPSVVSVRVSSSVRKEALQPHHEPHENSVVPAAATRSHFGVEAAGYRETVKEVEDSLAEASQDFQQEKKPYAEALTFQESGIGYESRVKSDTSESRVYFSRPEPVEETIVVQTSRTRVAIPSTKREERKLVPMYQNAKSSDDRQYITQTIASQSREERRYEPHELISQNRDNRQQFSNQQIISEPKEEFESQKLVGRHTQQDYNAQKQSVEQYVTQQPTTNSHFEQYRHHQSSQQQQHHQYQPQQRQHETYRQPVVLTARNYEEDNRPREEEHHQPHNYEQPEQNYEVDEALSVMSNGRSHGVQTERPQQQQQTQQQRQEHQQQQLNKFGLVQEGENYRKYRVEEKTPDGFIVGEYGVVSHDDGGVRGVRYTADGSINPRLIYEALVKFLSLK